MMWQGFALFLARVLRPLWRVKLVKQDTKTKIISLNVTVEQMMMVAMPLQELRRFCEQHIRLFKSFNMFASNSFVP